MDSLLIQANAKINLDFKILGKLPTGYHQIQSTFQSVDLSDFLLFKKSEKDFLTGSVVCSESDNIILKAKSTLEEFLSKKLPCEIHLHKSIPISAGLGGGSADGAATLLGLNLIHNLGLSQRKLTEIGAKIGADLPFFFYGGTCKVEGIGEKITPIKKEVSKFFAIFRPHKRVGTKKMYRLYDETSKDFLSLNKEIYPPIKKLENYLNKLKLREKGLSGSGPTMFCGTNSHKSAKTIAEGYKNFDGDIFICQPTTKALDIIEL